ncbi:MAG: hypothetical protein UR66_C0012G0027 [Candidatus Moranbacteria bacterium GW2011_GWE1_35_17]|nr:MAG: hypothetical protein UR66_C0012G0027 [Candidatus Moranbacteria bacterium GW2011_GWE1_35_17]KKP81017.1 MAG: hypothetical protein UR82_C0074G0002 [Candidatus Moranbacteria bacterium GW2011_GWF1_35_5]KKP82728.1 MAG: hypothetical protein UR83_C0047G0007 [Candidatus Moranbacteria bacterium GW2011_GWF2_35_54]
MKKKIINKLKTLSQKRKLIFSLVLLVILPLSFYFYKKSAGASWWNSDWFYRKSIAVTNNTTAENNVYITLTLDTSDTIKFQTDFKLIVGERYLIVV